MGKQKFKVEIKVKDWRVSGVVGMLFGIVIATAPQFIGLLLLATAMAVLIKLVDKDRV